MKIRYKNGRKFNGDRIFSIETKGEEFFTHARMMVLINALAYNEHLVYTKEKSPYNNYTSWSETGRDFLFEQAMHEAIDLGVQGKVFIDQKDDNLLKDFCTRNKLMRKFPEWKQTILKEFIDDNNGHNKT